ncbi:hypothetical protein VB264_16390 [Arcicella aquatica]|uniref:Secreted protein (Por secretion system target) n=1 Tax=Arcicella aquatica TaxID=217141 RepID=A0ABU5QRC9_9BACT|nr:hypothetical protein [Arcicella aquatica]MEA5259379.1 hypothetical protein [Arcicella aquatica]
MKTLLRTLAIALCSTVSLIANAGDDATNGRKTLKVAIYPATNTMKMSVVVEKLVGRQLSVRLKSESGFVLHSEYIRKKDTLYFGKFNLEELEDGKYLIEIFDGETKIVKNIEIGTIKPQVVANERFITMN